MQWPWPLWGKSKFCERGGGRPAAHGWRIQAARSQLGGMESDWLGLSAVDEDFASDISKCYHSFVQLDGAIDDEEDAAKLVAEILGNKRPAPEVERVVEGFWKWFSRKRKIGASAPKRLASVIPSLPVSLIRAKRSIHEVFEDEVTATPAVALAQLQRAVRVSRTSKSREEVEATLRERWAMELVVYIKESKLPCADRMEALGDGKQHWLRLFGNRRGKTLRNRARAWAPVREWLQVTYGSPWPKSPEVLLRYLEERQAIREMGKSVPTSILASLSLLESIGMVAEEKRLSCDPMVVETIRSWTMELEADGPPCKPAPLLPVSAMLACEMMVCRPVYELGLRFTAFVLLLMIWSSLRCDDVQNIDPSSLRLSQVGLRFVLRKTKTSGPGRKVGELHAFVSRIVSLSGFDWIGEGVKLLGAETLTWSRDFLCPAFNREWDTPSREYMNAEGLALQLRRLLQHLPTPVRQQGVWKVSRELLFPGQLASFWTGHSARHVLTSISAALGVGKDRRDYLGRWAYAQHGSQDYVLTSRQVVQGVQNFVCRSLILGHESGGYSEEELFWAIRAHADSLLLDGAEIVKANDLLQWDEVQRTWKLGGAFPSFNVSPERVRQAAGDIDAQLPGPYEPFEGKEDGDEAPYFITVSRRGFRRLHLSKKCAVRRENCLETVPVHKLTEGIADAVCKLCRPKIENADASSTSGSDESAGEEMAEPEEPEPPIPSFGT